MKVLKWHGGKHYLAKHLVDISNRFDYVHRVETHFGGGSFLLASDPEGYSEVANDINGDLMNFFLCCAYEDQFEEFKRLVALLPLSEALWTRCLECGDDWSAEAFDVAAPEPRRAATFFIKYRQSRQAIGKSFATLSRNRTRRGMNEQVSAWLSAVDGLDELHARLQRVAIRCTNAEKVIQSEQGEKTLFYVDPPYAPETRTSPRVYANEMTLDDHQVLVETILKAEGTFIISHYPHWLYDKCFPTYQDFTPPNSAAGNGSRAIERVYIHRS